MNAMASQITGVSIVCSTVGAGADQRKYQVSASLAFVRGIHRWPASNEENVSTWWCHHIVSIQIECPTPIVGRYVAIGLLGFTYLVLQEVEVYAIPGECKLAIGSVNRE